MTAAARTLAALLLPLALAACQPSQVLAKRLENRLATPSPAPTWIHGSHAPRTCRIVDSAGTVWCQ